MQFVAPTGRFGVACAFEQGKQSAPGAPLKVPPAHSAQAPADTEPAGALLPAGQSEQETAPASENVPFGQSAQAEAPANGAKDPAEQRAHAPEARLEPAGQAVGEADAEVEAVGAAETEAAGL